MKRINAVVLWASFLSIGNAAPAQMQSKFWSGDLDGSNGFGVTGVILRDQVGYSCDILGDFNGDSYDDLLVSAFRWTIPDTPSGYATHYIVYGGPDVGVNGTISIDDIDGSNGFEITIDAARTGESVSGAGDFNGDGYDDILISADLSDDVATDAGYSYLIFGGPNVDSGTGTLAISVASFFDGVNGFRFGGVASGNRYGYENVGIGDINSDGFDDIAIGAYVGKQGFVVFGTNETFGDLGTPGTLNLGNLDGERGFSVTFNPSTTVEGIMVRGGGDLNSDGFEEVVFSSRNENSNNGEIYVIWGGSNVGSSGDIQALTDLNGTGTQGFTIYGVDGRKAGTSVASAGDFNGDGHDDLIIGEPTGLGRFLVSNPYMPWYPPSYSQVGVVYVVYGGPNVGHSGSIYLNRFDASSYGMNIEGLGGEFGRRLGPAGDLNGDGISDILIAAHRSTGFSSTGSSINDAGIEYVIYGGANIDVGGHFNLSSITDDTSKGFAISGQTTSNQMGFQIGKHFGDMNGDGNDDCVMSTIYFDNSRGRTAVVFGVGNVTQPPTFAPTPAPTPKPFKGANSESSFWSGDVNGKNGFEILSDSNQAMGTGVDIIGDFNGDGIDDIAFSAYPTGGDSSVYIFYGGTDVAATNGTFSTSDIDGVNGFKIGIDETFVGEYIGGAGDFNGDGYADLLIGAYLSDKTGGTDAGYTYLLFGGANVNGGAATFNILTSSHFNGVQGMKFGGFAAGDKSGYRLNGIGDINDDGLDDIAIADYAGKKAYVIFGFTATAASGGEISLGALTGTNGFTVTFSATTALDGIAVSSGGGDLNSDGINDVVFGSKKQNDASGQIYVIYGASDVGSSGNIDALSDLTGSGSQGYTINGTEGTQAGTSLSIVGDFNNDGHDDLIIGSRWAKSKWSPSSVVGKVYVVYGGPSVGDSGSISLDNLDGSNGFVIQGITHGVQFGLELGPAGDFNNDGIDDIFVAAFRSTGLDGSGASMGDTGTVYVIYGGDNGNIDVGGYCNLSSVVKDYSKGFGIVGEVASDQFGNAVGLHVGDFNNDGKSDVIIGGKQWGPSYAAWGRVVVVFGDELDTTPDPTSQPSYQPTFHPTPQPTFHPTFHPTPQPTFHPTFHPTPQPTFHPTPQPSFHPTFHPTPQPTFHPTFHPTPQPTFHPTPQPSFHPTFHPTPQPTFHPTFHPTPQPTFHPTPQPSFHPTPQPTFHPTAQPVPVPTPVPTTPPTMVDTRTVSISLTLTVSSMPTQSDISALKTAIATQLSVSENEQVRNFAVVYSALPTPTWSVTFDLVESVAATNENTVEDYETTVLTSLADTTFQSSVSTTVSSILSFDTVTSVIVSRRPTLAPTSLPTRTSKKKETNSMFSKGSVSLLGLIGGIGALGWILAGTLIAVYFLKLKGANAIDEEDEEDDDVELVKKNTPAIPPPTPKKPSPQGDKFADLKVAKVPAKGKGTSLDARVEDL